MDDNAIQVIDLEFPAVVKAVSVFKDDMHYIFLNTAISDELREIALQEELMRTRTK